MGRLRGEHRRRRDRSRRGAAQRRRTYRDVARRLDALPVRADTGLPYASTAAGTDPDGHTVPVMHACGHDIPDQAVLKFNVRTFDDGVRARVLDGIKRIVTAEATASKRTRSPSARTSGCSVRNGNYSLFWYVGGTDLASTTGPPRPAGLPRTSPPTTAPSSHRFCTPPSKPAFRPLPRPPSATSVTGSQGRPI